MRKSRFLVPMSLQMFAGELDLEAFRRDFEESYEEPEIETESEEEEVEVIDDNDGEVDDSLEDEADADSEGEEEDLEETEDDVEPGEDGEVEEPEPKKQSREDNAAFAEMRRQNEALQRQAALVEKAAAKYGMTTDQYLAAVEEAETKKRAEDMGVPLDVLKRLEAAENKLTANEKQIQEERFWNSVKSVKDNYGLDDDEVKNVFEYIGKEKLVNPNTGLPSIDFDKAYKIANFDKLQARKEKEAHQKRLADKKARQKKSAIPPGNVGTTTNSELDEITDDFVIKRLKSRGLL